MKLNNNKGVTLIALTVTVMVLLLITGSILYNTKNNVSVKKIDNLYVDINAISFKVNEYYLTYGEIPTLCKYLDKDDLVSLINTNARLKSATLSYESTVNPNDGTEYYVIDLEKLEDLSLNYGYNDEYETIKTNKSYTASAVEDEIYVINKQTHQIYFPHGFFVDGVMYYTSNDADFTETNIKVPSKSQVN